MSIEAMAAAAASWSFPVPGHARDARLCSQNGFGEGFRQRFAALDGHQSIKARLFCPASFPVCTLQHRLKLVFVASAADSTQPSATASSSDKTIVPDSDFSLAKVSFGVIGLALGGTLLSYGFGAYFTILPGSEWSALMLTYGFPLAIIGMALKYAELKPVPCTTYSDAQILREKCATPILKQEGLNLVIARITGSYYFPHQKLETKVRNDVIRYRYGDEQHLDEALKRIFQYGQGGGIPRRNAPILQMIREEVTEDGKYCLVLVFGAKALQLSDFEQRQVKFTSFFGPEISSEIGKGENDLYEVRLISNRTSVSSLQL